MWRIGQGVGGCLHRPLHSVRRLYSGATEPPSDDPDQRRCRRQIFHPIRDKQTTGDNETLPQSLLAFKQLARFTRLNSPMLYISAITVSNGRVEGLSQTKMTILLSRYILCGG